MDYRDLCLECEERHHAWFCNKYHDPLWVSVKKCSKNPINKDTKLKKESDNMNRLEELANMSVDSGSFLKLDNGYAFHFQVVDLQNIQEVIKPPFKEGGKEQVKYQWRIILKYLEIMDKVTVDYKRKINLEKCTKIENQKLNQAYTLELPKGASKKLAIYCIDHNIDSTMTLKFWRVGEMANTVYNFMTVVKE